MCSTLKPVRAGLLLLAAVGSAAGQRNLFDLGTTGDGGAVYFASTLVQRDSPEAATAEAQTRQSGTEHGRIYRVGPEGFQLFLERPRVDPPPPPLPGGGPPRFTNYFNLFGPQTSRDGKVVAVIGKRRCFGNFPCDSAATLQTSVTGLPGDSRDVSGAGSLSGNGRYLLIYRDGSIEGCAYVVDLQTGQETRRERCRGGGFSVGGGRSVADDGTAVLTGGSLFLIRGGAVTPVQTQTPMGSPGEAVIDSSARIVVYTLFDGSTRGYSIRIYRIAEQRDSELVALPGSDGYAPKLSASPYLSADGRRVMFISDVSGLPQIYTISTDGGAPQQVTSDTDGVLLAVMSDDGRVAWYFSGAARLYRVDLDTGKMQEGLGRTPQLGDITRAVAGSLYFIPGVGFSDRPYVAESYPLPRSLGGVSVIVNGVNSPLLSVSPTQIVFQVPFRAPFETNVEVQAESFSPFVPRLRFATRVETAAGSFLPNPRSRVPSGTPDILALHEDWTSLVTRDNPARPGEILHLYGSGFGQVDSPPPDGMPAPADPPARVVTPITCWTYRPDNVTKLEIPVLYAGLAPGLVGVYQMDVRLPPADLQPFVAGLRCSGEGDNNDNFAGPFALKP